MSNDFYAVIMAGGKGERFWPLSTLKHPKQLLSLVSDRPMLSLAVDHLDGIVPPERVLVITSADLVAATCRTAPNLPPGNVIGEPVGRDTAAACALGCALVEARNPRATFCVLTADHIIAKRPVFRAALRAALERAALEDVLITIGITPRCASTGFGYIDCGPSAGRAGETEFFEARRFVEKPELATAEKYVAAGNYYWNSGMFVWSAASLRKAVKRFRPQLVPMMDRMIKTAGGQDFESALADEYGRLERISIDYAVMEKADNILMVRGDFEWDDVGAWPAVANHLDADEQGNVVVGQAEILDGLDNVVVSRERLTALIGVKDLVVVQAPNATLICPRDRAQDVKEMVRRLTSKGVHGDVL